MTPLADSAVETALLPVLSSHTQGWSHIVVEQFQLPPGEAICHCGDDHILYLSLASQPVHLMQVGEGKVHSGIYAKGHLSVVPSQRSLFARWDKPDQFLQVRLAARFVEQVAQEVMGQAANRLELLPEFRVCDRTLETLGLSLLAELHQDNLGGALYVESLTNLLAVHLLRHYAVVKPQLKIYSGGLSKRHLQKVLEYIHDNLEQPIKLADLAALLGMSQFHFSHQFKQSLGLAPYQYLLQQRIERVKQLLKQTDQSIAEIALACGFNSHSHLSQQFRKLTNQTPNAYRRS